MDGLCTSDSACICMSREMFSFCFFCNRRGVVRRGRSLMRQWCSFRRELFGGDADLGDSVCMLGMTCWFVETGGSSWSAAANAKHEAQRVAWFHVRKTRRRCEAAKP